MATQAQLRNYLSRWFQLGKSVQVQTTGETLRPDPVMRQGSYSSAFEDCWEQLQIQGFAKCYLEGTGENLAELLGSHWDLADCARCGMPVAHRVGGITPATCPCHDLPHWPNTQLPFPRGEQNWRSQLHSLNQRIGTADQRYRQPES